jgi:hypothetical protein
MKTAKNTKDAKDSIANISILVGVLGDLAVQII